MAMARGGVFAGNDEVTQRNLSTSDLVSFASDALKSLQPALGVFGSGGIQTRDGAAFAKLIGTDFESQLAAEQYGPCSPGRGAVRRRYKSDGRAPGRGREI